MDDIRTVALTAGECALLRVLLRTELPVTIHSIVTSPLEAKAKTGLIVKTVDNYHTLQNVLVWQPTDNLRAYRQLNSDGVIALQHIVSEVDPMALPEAIRDVFEPLKPRLLETLGKALVSEMRRPLTPVSLVKPVAKA